MMIFCRDDRGSRMTLRSVSQADDPAIRAEKRPRTAVLQTCANGAWAVYNGYLRAGVPSAEVQGWCI